MYLSRNVLPSYMPPQTGVSGTIPMMITAHHLEKLDYLSPEPSTSGDWARIRNEGFPIKPTEFHGTGARLRHDLGCG